MATGRVYCPRTLITQAGKLELRVPKDRQGRFSTELFERYQRSGKAPVSAKMEMYEQGVSTRKVKAITEELATFQLAQLAAILPRHIRRVPTLLRKARILHDPRLDRTAHRHHRLAHPAQQRIRTHGD